MKKYELGFISDADFFSLVQETVKKYKKDMSLNEFNANIVDPIKIAFDAAVYKRSIKDIVEIESLRQIDKSNNNYIGYFHQNIFSYIGNNWETPKQGFDVINNNLHIFGEIKNKHNTMNSSSAKATYEKMQQKILEDSKATCYLIEIISKKSQDTPWNLKLEGKSYSHDKIRKISIDRFLAIATGDNMAFYKMCKALPQAVLDATQNSQFSKIESTVFLELKKISPDIYTSLFHLAFNSYIGFKKE